MQDIQTIAINNYQDNLAYFQEKHPPLYNKLLALDTLLNEGRYPQRYDLEYKDGYFDVIELSSGHYLYNTNSITHAKEMCENVTFIKNDHVIESFENIQYDLKKTDISDLKKINPFRPHLSVAPIINYYNQHIQKTSTLMHIYKYIFFGVGLGLHLDCIAKKTQADIFFIVEDDIELFRLSLFTCNYKTIFQNKSLYFSIAQNEAEFSQSFTNFYMRAIIENHFLKFSVFAPKDEKYIKKVQAEIVVRPEKCYAHHALLLKNSRIMKRITKNYKFLSMLQKENAFFNDKPLLILGAGPSLGNNQEWLRENHKKFIIIAPFVTLKLLYKLNITPDIIVHIDEGDPVATREVTFHQDHLDFFKNSLFIFSASASEIFFTTFEKEKIYLLEDRTTYKLNNNCIQVASVGETVYAIGLSLSKNDIYLLGLDLAVADDGTTHMKEHASSKSSSNVDTSSGEILEESASLRKTTLLVKGNFRDKVPTIPLFEMSIRSMNLQAKIYTDKNRNVYNISDGAYFNETTPYKITNVKLQNIQMINKQDIYNSLKNILDNFSSGKLTTQEIENIYQRQERVEQYYKLLDDFWHSSSSDNNMFIRSFSTFISQCLSMKQDEIHQVLFVYFLETATYITDIFTTKELDNRKKHIKKIKKMFYTLVYNLIQTYDKDLQALIEKIKED
jgi:hypothetical protein